jgi:glycosyltransferase involved in cell wall biosynthesis
LHILLLSAGKVFKTPFGGEDLLTRLLGGWLANNHHEVTLIGIEFAGIRARHITYENVKNQTPKIKKKKNGTKKIGLDYILYSLRTVIWFLQVLKILSINVKHPVNVIHAQDSGYTGLAAIVVGKILSVPVIISLSGIRYNQIESNPYVNEILKKIALKIEHKLDVFTLRNADLVTMVSSTMKYYVQEVAPKSIIATIPAAIKTENFEFSDAKREQLRRELGIDNKSKVIGYIGRLSYEKNLFTLLNSFADAAKFDYSLKLVLVGEGPLEFELRKKARDIHIEDKVIFCGYRDDISNILSGIDIFVLPSFIEGTSTALLQAMTCGRAIICSDISGNRELVTNNKEALLVNPNDRDGFRQAIILLSSDDTLRSRLGFNAKINANQYDEDIVLPKFLQYYQDLCKKHQ